MTFKPFVIAWACLAVVVVALAIFRNLAALHEDDNLHLAAGEQPMIPRQLAFFKMMDKLDRWGKGLTTVAAGSGLLLLAVYVYVSVGARM